MKKILFIPIILLSFHFVAFGQLTVEFSRMAWLNGQWKGEVFGGDGSETWMEVQGGAMMGTFRSIKDDKVSFYEFMIIDNEGLKIKHFSANLDGWEEKGETTFFPFISQSDNEILFDGMRYLLIDKNTLRIDLAQKKGDEVITVTFYLKRQKKIK